MRRGPDAHDRPNPERFALAKWLGVVPTNRFYLRTGVAENLKLSVRPLFGKRYYSRTFT